jgi:hypothetical protein
MGILAQDISDATPGAHVDASAHWLDIHLLAAVLNVPTSSAIFLFMDILLGWTVGRAPSSPPFDFFLHNKHTLWFNRLNFE